MIVWREMASWDARPERQMERTDENPTNRQAMVFFDLLGHFSGRRITWLGISKGVGSRFEPPTSTMSRPIGRTKTRVDAQNLTPFYFVFTPRLCLF